MSEPDLTDPDNPEWTEADFKRARKASDIFPAAVATALVRSMPVPKLVSAISAQSVLIRSAQLAA